MRILMLQHVFDAMGGSFMVNCVLAEKFLKENHEVFFLSIRSSGRKETVPYPSAAKALVVAKEHIWDVPRLNEAVAYLKKGNVVSAFAQIRKRKQYDALLKKDYLKCQKMIQEIAPDAIICSHYECLDAIPKEYLCKTFNHYHTTFDQVIENKSQLPFFQKYQNQVARLIWLSESTCKKALENGLTNSDYVYNPIRFTSKEVSLLNQKKILFLGRFSEEKRVELLVKLFVETIDEYQIDEWKLSLVGMGEISDECMQVIKNHPAIELCGPTDNPKKAYLDASILALTSRFEGFNLSILEANECGVPCIAFNFGEAAKEEIPANCGVIVNQNDEVEYKKQLAQLMKNDEWRFELGFNAKKRAAEFEIDEIYEKWMQLFKKAGE